MAEIIIGDMVYKISCGMHDCDKDMHSFKSNKTLQNKGIEKGCCINCRSSLIDWDRIFKKDIDDFEYTKRALKLEMIRNCFWTIKKPTPEMIKKIKDLTPEQLDTKVYKRLRATLAKPRSENIFDGRQTSLEDNDFIHWAQHATGTCCRSCLEEWYNIDANAEMIDSDYDYLGSIIKRYLTEKTT